MAAGQRTFDHDVIRRAVNTRVLAQKQLQRAQRRNNDAEFGVAKPRMISDQTERTQMQAGRERNAVDARIQRGGKPHAQGVFRRVHRQLFHAVDEDHALAALGLHGASDVVMRRLGEPAEIKQHGRFVGIRYVVFVALELFLGEMRAVAAVRHRLHHGIRDVPDTTKTRRL